MIIAGGGIGGLSLALTLHQIGVPCLVLERVRDLKPIGVGINIQPNAVRELLDLGISLNELDGIGHPAREWALVGLNGAEIHAEPRGLEAGYRWPQYAIHRGELQMLLYRKVVERLGRDAIKLGTRVTAYENVTDGVVVTTASSDGSTEVLNARLLIGADGLHSAVRAQMHPEQPPIHWGGAVMWRGTSLGVPLRTGASFVGFGSSRQRLVCYPITAPDKDTGLATINWIAEVTFDAPDDISHSNWFKEVAVDSFAHHFAGWPRDWLDVPALLNGSDTALENPMVDRDPVPTWQDGNVALLGDAAHVMYPTGSNGASQAIVDARVLGAMLIAHGVSAAALASYDARLCGPVSELVLRNRSAGPFGLLDLVDERCGGSFDSIEDVVPANERAEFMSAYKAAAGFAIEQLNAAPPTIAPGERVQ